MLQFELKSYIYAGAGARAEAFHILLRPSNSCRLAEVLINFQQKLFHLEPFEMSEGPVFEVGVAGGVGTRTGARAGAGGAGAL